MSSNSNSNSSSGSGDKWNFLARTFQMKLEEAITSPVVILWFVIFASYAFLGFSFMEEDLYTTEIGYNMLPTRSPYPNTGWYVALLLWLTPLVGTLMYQVSGNATWLKVGLVSLLTDALFDTIYRVVTSPFVDLGAFIIELVIGLIQSLTIFTFGSEVAVSLGLTMSITLAPYALYQVFVILFKVFSLAGIPIKGLSRSAASLKAFLDENESGFFRPRFGQQE